MIDFANWCMENQLINIAEDGSVTWKEEAIRGQKHGSHKEKFAGGRDQRKDLSDDYKDYCHHMGTVWPFKVIAKDGKAPAAKVAK